MPVDVRQLIDRYVSEQNALGARYGMLAYLLGFSDCKAMFLGKCIAHWFIYSTIPSISSGLSTKRRPPWLSRKVRSRKPQVTMMLSSPALAAV